MAGKNAQWKRDVAAMSEEQRKTWNDHRIRTSKTGYAARQRERGNGAPMKSRTGEGLTLRTFPVPFTRPDPKFAGWLRDFQRMTA